MCIWRYSDNGYIVLHSLKGFWLRFYYFPVKPHLIVLSSSPNRLQQNNVCILFAWFFLENSTCPSGYFRCKSGQCLVETDVCNKFKQCKDGSDEHNCGKNTIISIRWLFIWLQLNMLINCYLYISLTSWHKTLYDRYYILFCRFLWARLFSM